MIRRALVCAHVAGALLISYSPSDQILKVDRCHFCLAAIDFSVSSLRETFLDLNNCYLVKQPLLMLQMGSADSINITVLLLAISQFLNDSLADK